jgi:hypothetical protein
MSQKYKSYPIEIDGSSLPSFIQRMALQGLDALFLNALHLDPKSLPNTDLIFEDGVKKLLGQIEGRSKTGTILLDALPAGKKLRIVPYLPGYTGTGAVCNAQSMWADGRIEIDPFTWMPVTRACTVPSQLNGTSGTRADEVLMHEMVHSVRTLNGRNLKGGATALNVGKYQNYGDTEEFIAILITNISISEQGIKNLRRDHNGAGMLPVEWSTSAGFLSDATNRKWVEHFYWNEPMAMTIATTLPASVQFNPFRQVYLETQKAMKAIGSAAHKVLHAVGL